MAPREGLSFRINRSDMATFFEPGVAVMEQAIQDQKAAAHVPVTVRVS